RVSRGGVQHVAVIVTRVRDHEHRVGARTLRVVGGSAAAPEDRQLGRLADACERAAHDDGLRAVRLRDARGVRPVDVDDHRDAVSLGDRLAESSRAPFQRQTDRNRSGTLILVRARTVLVPMLVTLVLPAAGAAGLISGTARAGRLGGTVKADRIDTLFGGVDRVKCGKGVDAVTADPGDSVAADCEYVSRPISSDTLVAAAGQHQTEVEPSVAGWGSTAV